MHQNISDKNITWQNMYVDYFKTMNWLSVDQWVQQRLNITIFIYVNNVCPYYMKEVFEYASQGRISSRNNYARLKN